MTARAGVLRNGGACGGRFETEGQLRPQTWRCGAKETMMETNGNDNTHDIWADLKAAFGGALRASRLKAMQADAEVITLERALAALEAPTNGVSEHVTRPAFVPGQRRKTRRKAGTPGVAPEGGTVAALALDILGTNGPLPVVVLREEMAKRGRPVPYQQVFNALQNKTRFKRTAKGFIARGGR